MRGLGSRLALATIAIAAACASYPQGRDALAAPVAAEPAIELELAGLAIPASPHGAMTAEVGSRAVLAPSCDVNAPGACDRLQAICTDLQGTITGPAHGRLTCLVFFD